MLALEVCADKALSADTASAISRPILETAAGIEAGTSVAITGPVTKEDEADGA